MNVLWEIRRAVPLVSRGEEDCCSRLVSLAGVPSRDVARTWLTLLEGLGLVAERTGGFHRTRRELDRDGLTEAFVEGVFGAAEALDLLERQGPLTSHAVFEEVASSVPPWERNRDAGWRDAWRRRTDNLLDWLVLLGRVEQTPEGYVPK